VAAVLRAGIGVFAISAQAVATGREAVRRADLRSLARDAIAITAFGRTVAQAVLRGFVKRTDSIAAPAAVQETQFCGLSADAFAIPTAGQAILRAGAPARTVFVEPAHPVAAWPAVHRAPLAILQAGAGCVAAIALADHGQRAADAFPIRAVVVFGALVSIFTGSTLVARCVGALPA